MRRSLRTRSASWACVFAITTTSAALGCPTAHPLLSTLDLTGAPGCADPCGDLSDCGPGSGLGESGGFSAGRGAPLFDISAVDFTFLPNAPIIRPNTTVRWTNTGLFPHTSTRFPTWDSGFLNSGQFFDFTFTDVHAGKAWDYDCILHPGMEGTVQVARFGDANLDGVVNLSDFNILAANFGQSGHSWQSGDFNGDGLVNLSDFNALAANFGREIDPAGLTLQLDSFVPEPAVACLVTPLLLLSQRRRARRTIQ